MKVCRIIPLGAVSLCLTLFSCATSSSTYVSEAVGWSVTKGDVLEVSYLNSKSNEVLSDGVAIKISQPGCKVLIRLEDKSRTFELGVDSILLYGKDSDYILVPVAKSTELTESSRVPETKASSISFILLLLNHLTPKNLIFLQL